MGPSDQLSMSADDRVFTFHSRTPKGGEKLVLTGQLGDVMKESAQIALSAVRARASEYGLDDVFLGLTGHAAEHEDPEEEAA